MSVETDPHNTAFNPEQSTPYPLTLCAENLAKEIRECNESGFSPEETLEVIEDKASDLVRTRQAVTEDITPAFTEDDARLTLEKLWDEIESDSASQEEQPQERETQATGTLHNLAATSEVTEEEAKQAFERAVADVRARDLIEAASDNERVTAIKAAAAIVRRLQKPLEDIVKIAENMVPSKEERRTKKPKRKRNSFSKENQAHQKRQRDSLKIDLIDADDWNVFDPEGTEMKFTPQAYEGEVEKDITRHILHLANADMREAKQSKGDDADIIIRYRTPNTNPNTVYLEGMSVPVDLRGQGLGKQALKYFMEDAAEQGLKLSRTEVIRKPLLAKMLKESGWEPLYEKDENGKNIIIKGELIDDGSGQPDNVPVVCIIEGVEAEQQQRRESKRGSRVFYRTVPREGREINYKNLVNFDCRWKPPTQN